MKKVLTSWLRVLVANLKLDLSTASNDWPLSSENNQIFVSQARIVAAAAPVSIASQQASTS